MRAILSLAALLAVQSVTAQGTPVPVPAFNNTFSSTGATRGLFFQAPIPFIITDFSVPDETSAGVQNVEIYVTSVPPPAFSALLQPTASELRFAAYNVPVTGTPIPTGNINVAPGQWVIAIGACGTTTMNNSYAASGAFASNVLGAPISMARCGTQFNIFTNPGPANGLWSEVAGPISRVELFVVPDPNFIQPPELVATSEVTPGTNPLGTTGGQFRDLDFLTYDYNDTAGVNGGLLIWNTINVGIGGSPPVGVTSNIANLVNVWPGSTPAGVAELFGPTVIGSPPTSLFIPPGIFGLGDTVRMQGIVLDGRVGTSSNLPINPTLNTIQFTFTNCFVEENFDNLATGVGVYPAGWTNGGGGAEWSVIGGPTGSAGTGPSGATSGSNYMYCETSAPVAGRTFIMNTATYATGGFANINFDLSRVGATIGTLEVRWGDGTGTFPNVLATYTGAETSGLEWTSESFPVPAGAGANIQFQFSYAQGSSFTGDIGIDGFCLN